ncbi:fumarylacetoacetate hydrolase family protein [Bacillus massiliigorillae]|uniref:fumarylacetoacetate hydrolase family protein n=1 Tax=Bacillus massiliigorillae TaxID=1243664 RepID=UPI0003AB32D4|nr:fumarylacetoacetate hydrolase family protein [Bacillus massiliigorillae]
MIQAKIKLQNQLTSEDIQIENNQIIKNGNTYDVSQLQIDVPIKGTVYGTLLNYRGELEAMKEQMNQSPYNAPPKGPILYIKPKNTYTSFAQPIPLPQDTEQLSVGAALGIVIRKTATRITEEEALNYIEGYTIVNDISIPHESVYRPAIRFKARDKFCPIGPWIVNASSVTNPNDLRIRVLINETTVQENTTANLVRPIAKLLADVTDFMTLQAGDILLVGVAEHAPLAKIGDHIRIEIDEIGYLENTIVQEENVAMEGNQ